MRAATFAISFLCLLGSFGCATTRIALTQEMREQHRLSDNDLRNLQYYNSHPITLRRAIESTGREVSPGHKLVLRSGRMVEEVVIDEGTPGVAVQVGRQVIVVAFGEGAELAFGLRDDGTTYTAPSDAQPRESRFAQPPSLLPAEPEEPVQRATPTGTAGKFWLLVAGPDNGVQFQGKWFEAVEQSIRAHLLIDAEQLEDEEQDRRVLPGVRL